MVATTTPSSINLNIRKLCGHLGIGWKPRYVQVQARQDSWFQDCFNDVARHVEEHGGRIVYGWALWEWPRVLVEAEFHAIWENPAREWLDVSAKPNGEERILFVEDKTKAFAGARVDNVRLSIGKDPRIQELIFGKEKFFRLFEAEHGNATGDVVLKGDLASLHQALTILGAQLSVDYR